MSARKNLQRLLLVVTLVFSFILSSLVPEEVMAQLGPEPCTNLDGIIVTTDILSPYFADALSNSISVTISGLTPNTEYTLYVWAGTVLGNETFTTHNGTISKTWTTTTDSGVFGGIGNVGSIFPTRYIRLSGADIPICEVGTFELVSAELLMTNPILYQEYDANGDGEIDQCSISNGGCLVTGQPIFAETRIISSSTGDPVTDASILHDLIGEDQYSTSHVGDGVYRSNLGILVAGSYTIRVEENAFWNNPNIGEVDFDVDLPSSCTTCNPPADPTDDSTTIGALDVYNFCNQISDPSQRTNCLSCSGGIGGYSGVWTAVGCISREPTSIARTFIRIGLSMSGGVALLMILAAGFILATSEGDPKRTSEAKEMVTAAVIGLIFVIFSVVILQFIGFTVLQIPGFGG